ncbi:amidohydrolase family protein [Jiella pelagia]|uniref:Amidohydrolase family protein n=1 Tax=Jiella pelagia TaxID=2986949 RepID=A0ABY7BZ64_9HYPH|nr:amidohydrolase family protein [Jiella pelagia]WAP68271.1 amidohydrolase family protein [Jiella pelagia]
MPQEPPSSLLLTNGRFYRDAFDTDPASALLVQGREIAWIGDRRDAPSAGRTIDLGGALVLPGLTDAHIHVFSLAMARHQLSFAEHRPATIAAVMEILRQEDRRLASDEWLQGSGINEAALGEQRLPARQEPRRGLRAETGAAAPLLRSCRRVQYCGDAAARHRRGRAGP